MPKTLPTNAAFAARSRSKTHAIASFSRRFAPIITTSILLLVLYVFSSPAFAGRIKDVANIQGVRNNQLVGYGLVVGLSGTGDQTTQTPFTTQAMGNMLAQMGINMTPDEAKRLQLKNVAAVMVTTNLPAFAQPGQTLDVMVSSMGNAKSLRGGTLIFTPLRGADGQIYAMAQGTVLMGGEGVFPGGARVSPKPHESAATIPAGATVERAVPNAVGENGVVFYELNTVDFETVKNIVSRINQTMGKDTAKAIDGRRLSVNVPSASDARVSFLGRVENLNITTSQGIAKVVINPRTGSVVMNQRVEIDPCAVAHGNLSVVIDNRTTSGGENVAIQYVKQENDEKAKDLKTTPGMVQMPSGTSLAEVVKALNALGASPMDLLAILQAMKAAGALRAELEVI